MATQSGSAFYSFKIGKFSCLSVSDGTYDYKSTSFLPGISEDEIKKILVEHGVPTDIIVSPYTFLFVDTGQHKILCDMGAGKLGPNTGKLMESLKSAGIQPEDIDTVIITMRTPIM